MSPDPPPPALAAIGELVCDHLFVGTDSRRYIGSLAGGPAFNSLAEVATAGLPAFAFAAFGDDPLGHFLRQDLVARGIDVVGARPNGGLTKAVFETVRREPGQLFEETDSRFTSTCLVCGQRPPESGLARWRRHPDPNAMRDAGIGGLFFDRLTTERLQLAGEARQLGIGSALRLARIGQLRYQPATRTVAELGSFDLVLLRADVALSLQRRLDLAGPGELARLAGSRLLAISHVRGGLTVLQGDDEHNVPLPDSLLIRDEAGADDVLLAHLMLAQLTHLEPGDRSTFGSLLEQAIARATEALRYLGARGHLPVDAAPPAALREREGATLQELRSEVSLLPSCHFCLQPIGAVVARNPRAARRPGAAHNVSWLQRRMLHATERKQAIQRVRSLLQLGGTCFVVGSGGSYPVASFVSLALDHHSEAFARPIRPFDYIRLGKPSDSVVVISYSGATPDCEEVIRAARRLGVRRIALLTAATDPPLAQLLDPSVDSLISYGNPEAGGVTERGFISIAGTVAPAALWTAAVSPREEIVALARDLERVVESDTKSAERLARAIESEVPIAFFGGGLAWPALHDIESKFVEGDLGEFQVHEAKDFSHGRFISVLAPERTRRMAVLFGIGPPSDYEVLLQNTLRDSGGEEFLPVGLFTERPGLPGALEMLVRVQHFTEHCAQRLGRDISRPDWIPPAGLELYRWSGGLAEGLEDGDHWGTAQLGLMP